MDSIGKGLDPLEALEHIDPAGLNYQEWLTVGMGLKEAGCPASFWEDWSRRDPARYHAGECLRKWETFHGASGGTPVAAGTVFKMALDRGWRPTQESAPGHMLDWEDTINTRDGGGAIVDRAWLEGKEVQEPTDWHPAKDLITYLTVLFDPSEYVGYVTETFKGEDGRQVPSKGNYDRTAGQLIDALRTCKDDIGAVLGDSDPDVGAWIRFNPLDGKGVKNENVTAFRYALVESDEMNLEEQHAMIRELELPVAALVSSGGKSLHAIVRIEAGSFEEYRSRVDYLYAVCEKNGLKVDRQNRNPSRLSRLPGVMRRGKKQFLLSSNIGKASWSEWRDWMDSVTDDMPDPESMAAVWDNLPELAPPLIAGVLRQGHKMLIAGPSKAGKSFLQIEMCIAIAEGREWLGWKCTQGRVLYVNLELDRASCLHRFRDVYQALGWKPDNLKNIDIWNLRGKSRPMDKLAPMLIRRAAKKNYIAIVIDPIYKVITGDENSADQMANFCNQFDKVCTELGVAVIYCHHHSKGGQGSKKAMDRASGSGVFARDPDAMLDMIELELSEDVLKAEENKAVCAACKQYLDAHFKWEDDLSEDDLCSSYQMLIYCENKLDKWQWAALQRIVEAAKIRARAVTAWRIEGTLREFPKFPAVNLWFDYPCHRVDGVGILNDIQPEADGASWQKNFKKKRTPEQAKKDRMQSLEEQYESLKSFNEDGKVTVKELAESMGTTEKTVRNRIKEHGGFWIDEGNVGKK